MTTHEITRMRRESARRTLRVAEKRNITLWIKAAAYWTAPQTE